MKGIENIGRRGAKIAVGVHRGSPYLRFVCGGCQHVQVYDWKSLQPDAKLICHHCGLRVTLTQATFARIRGVLETQLRTERWGNDTLKYPCLWVP